MARMHEPLTMRECRMAVVSDQHPLWPGEGTGEGAGAVIPLDREDLSMGMATGNESMWMGLSSDKKAQARGAPSRFEAKLVPGGARQASSPIATTRSPWGWATTS